MFNTLPLSLANRTLDHSVSVCEDILKYIILYATSFVVTLGWIIGKPLTLLFDPLESIVLFFTGDHKICVDAMHYRSFPPL
jgi:hypothetical protein